MKKHSFLPVFFASLAGVWLLVAGCELRNQELSPLRPGAVVLAFGDSLTEGVGAPPEQSYPAQLERIIKRRVVSAGVSGETTAQGLNRLPKMLDTVSPDLVIICMGGNDLLHGIAPDVIARNLKDMVRMLRARNREVVLVAVPNPRLALRPHPLYKQVAEEMHTPLEQDVVADVLSDSSLRSDLIHPNGRGYAKIAHEVADLLRKHGALPRNRH